MNIFKRRTVPQLLCLWFVLLLLVGCNDIAATVRQVTYPPDFTYVTTDELQSRMQQLAYNLQQLDQALADETADSPELQQDVAERLRNIERIGSSIQAGEAGSNHPFLEDELAGFLANIRQARMAVARNPPSYYMVGRISGGCVNCHQVNR